MGQETEKTSEIHRPEADAKMGLVLPGRTAAESIDTQLPVGDPQLRLVFRADGNDPVEELFDPNGPHVTVLPAVTRDPRVSVTALLVELVKALLSVHSPPTPSKVIVEVRDTPFVSMVFPVAVAPKTMLPVNVRSIPAVPPDRFKLP